MFRFICSIRLGFICAVALASAATLGCGSGSSNEASVTSGPRTSVTTSSVSKTEYINRANGVCEKSWAIALPSFQRRYKSTLHGKAFNAASQNIFLPSLQLQFDDIQYIGAPDGDERQVEEMIGALQLAVYRGEEQIVSSPRQMVHIFAKFSRLAIQYGIDSCPVEEATFKSSS